MKLKELRISKGLTQEETAKYVGVGLRTYIRYEKSEDKEQTIKYNYILERLDKYGQIDETHGVLDVETIRSVGQEIFSRYGVEYAYLFGSYAKAKATEESDVDILVGTSCDGLKFYELTEELRERLKKRVDVLHHTQLTNNAELFNEILKDGIKIF